MLNDILMYKQSRKDGKAFKRLLDSSSVSMPGYGLVNFRHIVLTSALTPIVENALRKMHKLTIVAKTLLSICQNLVDMDKYYHFDSIAEAYFDDYQHNQIHAKFFFDFKSVKHENIGTKKYSISPDCQEYYRKTNDNNWLAFRLSITRNGGKPYPLDAFWCVKAKEVFDNCKPIGNRDYLFSLNDILEKCKSKFFVGKREDLEKFNSY